MEKVKSTPRTTKNTPRKPIKADGRAGSFPTKFSKVNRRNG